MTVDLSRSIRSLMDGALERARGAQAAGATAQAAAAYDDAARHALQYAEYAVTPGEKKRRLEAAAGFRAQAEEVRSRAAGKPRTTDSHMGGAAAETESELDAAVAGLVHRSSVGWDDIAGLRDTKQSIMSAYAISLARAPEGIRLSPVRNVLFYGPPGCGKSLLAAATSNGLDATFFNVKVSNLLSKYFGESPKLVSSLYEAARREAPSVVFLDEVDALAGSRDAGDSGPERRLLANLLAELDGVAEKAGNAFVLTIAATNTPWSLDPAVLSRFERKVYIPLPDLEARREILELQLVDRGYEVDGSLEAIAAQTDGMSGREMERFAKILIERMILEMNPNLSEIAGRGRKALAEYEVRVRPLSQPDVDVVLEQMRPDTTTASLDRYREWEEQ